MNDAGALRLTARHEAAHAIAALHYDCPMEFASIAPGKFGSLGSTRIAPHRKEHGIVLYCGPLAEREWEEFARGEVRVETLMELFGGDLEALESLALARNECFVCMDEAVEFLNRREVQEQIDRVANALLKS